MDNGSSDTNDLSLLVKNAMPVPALVRTFSGYRTADGLESGALIVGAY